MDQNRPTPPPAQLKPWYYQDWFLFPAFVFWPVWSVLILRSPWHNGLVSGAVAWSLIIVGLFEIVWHQLIQTGRLHELAITIAVPGLLLTVLTQVLWTRDKQRVQQEVRQPDRQDAGAPAPGPGGTRPRRRGRRRSARSSRRR